MRSLIRAAAIGTALFAPTLALAATTIFGGTSSGGSFLGISFGSGAIGCAGGAVCNLANMILFVINSVLVPVIFALAFIVFLWGVFKKYIWSHGDPEAVKEGHQLILWGLIGFVVMISIWGLVNVVANTFNLYGYRAPPLPTSY